MASHGWSWLSRKQAMSGLLGKTAECLAMAGHGQPWLVIVVKEAGQACLSKPPNGWPRPAMASHGWSWLSGKLIDEGRLAKPPNAWAWLVQRIQDSKDSRWVKIKQIMVPFWNCVSTGRGTKKDQKTTPINGTHTNGAQVIANCGQMVPKVCPAGAQMVPK